MPTITPDSKLSKSNYRTTMRRALRGLDDVKIEVQTQVPWNAEKT